MHVATLLSSAMFEVALGGRSASIADVFPDWTPHDRFGLIIDEPMGGLGATHLIQIAITSFYDVKPVRRAERRIYPEIYALHSGRGYGAHTDFDFWPPRREAIVAGDHRDMLDAINDRGITRLAIPDRPARPLAHRPKEEDAALDRIVTAVIYNPSGRVSDPDFSIRGNDKRTEFNPRKVLRLLTAPPASPRPVQDAARHTIPLKELDADYDDWINKRRPEIDPTQALHAERRRTALYVDGLATETYRFTTVEDALRRI